MTRDEILWWFAFGALLSELHYGWQAWSLHRLDRRCAARGGGP